MRRGGGGGGGRGGRGGGGGGVVWLECGVAGVWLECGVARLLEHAPFKYVDSLRWLLCLCVLVKCHCCHRTGAGSMLSPLAGGGR